MTTTSVEIRTMYSAVPEGKGNPAHAVVRVSEQPEKRVLIVFVLDESGSMLQGTRPAFSIMRSACLDFVEKVDTLREEVTLCALSFSNKTRVLLAPTLVGGDNVKELCKTLEEKLRSAEGGGTNLQGALVEAFEQMQPPSAAEERKRPLELEQDVHLFVLTDGQDSDLSYTLKNLDESLKLDKAVKQLLDAPSTTIHMVSMGDDISPDLNGLVIKRAQRGTDNIIPDAEAIPAVLGNLLDYVHLNVTQNLVLLVTDKVSKEEISCVKLQLKVLPFALLLLRFWLCVILLGSFTFPLLLLCFCCL